MSDNEKNHTPLSVLELSMLDTAFMAGEAAGVAQLAGKRVNCNTGPGLMEWAWDFGRRFRHYLQDESANSVSGGTVKRFMKQRGRWT